MTVELIYFWAHSLKKNNPHFKRCSPYINISSSTLWKNSVTEHQKWWQPNWHQKGIMNMPGGSDTDTGGPALYFGEVKQQRIILVYYYSKIYLWCFSKYTMNNCSCVTTTKYNAGALLHQGFSIHRFWCLPLHYFVYC